MPTDRTVMTEEELRRDFGEYAKALERGGDPWIIYLKANSMRKIWNELHRRRLPDLTFDNIGR